MKSLQYFINILKQKYEIAANMEGNLYIGVTLDCNHTKVEVNCSMQGYLPRVLQHLLHISPNKPQDSPHPEPQVTRGQKIQLALNGCIR